ncbi:MAG: hypothetical protein R3336_02630 [Phycisphaeraceae bacterium]|nr:hypothetical protein [Phycisphaeraceae bacterium]
MTPESPEPQASDSQPDPPQENWLTRIGLHIRTAYRRLAGMVTAALLTGLAILLLIFWFDKQEPGGLLGGLLEPFWLNERRSQITLVSILAIAAIPATIIAWSARGWHRLLLVIGWILLGGALGWWFGDRLVLMLHTAWENR